MSRWQRPSVAFCESNACVEVSWSKRCDSAHCVEVGEGASDGLVRVRASWDESAVTAFTAVEWSVFLRAVKAGEYDHMID